VCWQVKPLLESGSVKADPETTVEHSYNLLINDVKLVQSLEISLQVHFSILEMDF